MMGTNHQPGSSFRVPGRDTNSTIAIPRTNVDWKPLTVLVPQEGTHGPKKATNNRIVLKRRQYFFNIIRKSYIKCPAISCVVCHQWMLSALHDESRREESGV